MTFLPLPLSSGGRGHMWGAESQIPWNSKKATSPAGCWLLLLMCSFFPLAVVCKLISIAIKLHLTNPWTLPLLSCASMPPPPSKELLMCLDRLATTGVSHRVP